VVDVEAEAGFKFIWKNWRPLLEAYWRQLAVGGLRRFVWFGVGKHLLLPGFRDFREVYFSVLKEVRREEGRPLEVFGSLDMVMEPRVVEVYGEVELPVEARLGALDLDMKHQEVPPDEALARFAETAAYLAKWGILPELRLSGGGVHATFPLYPALVGDALAVNEKLAEHLGRRFKLRFDPKIYSDHRLFRLSFSWHKSGVFSIPLRPWELEELKWEDLRRLAGDTEEVKARLLDYGWTWKPLGELEDPEKACKLFRLLKPLEIAATPTVKVGRRTGAKGDWRRVKTPDLGTIEYSSELEGFGWVAAAVEAGALLRDGKLNAAWLMLAPAVARNLLAMEKAEEWLRKAAEACGVDPEPYIEKFRREVERRKGRPEGSPELALPTWRTLLTRRKKDGDPLSDYYDAIRGPLLEALAEKGLVRLRAAENAAQPASSWPPLASPLPS
jgi:hypothetical protein